MSSNAYNQATSRSALLRAWQLLYQATKKRSRNTPGVDGISVNDFKADGVANVNKLAGDLRAETFTYDELRPHFVPKPNGKMRLICVPTVKDRIVQRALLGHLSRSSSHLIDNDVSYGFVHGRTVERAARRAIYLRQRSPWVLKTDICAFFDNVDRERLEAELRHCIRERSLHSLLLAAVRCDVHIAGERDLRRMHKLGVRRGRGIRQGMPLSPFFSNIVLREFDAAIIRCGINAVRYADDLILFASSPTECEAIFAFCKRELLRIGLELPEPGVDSKTQIIGPSQPTEFLGLGLYQTPSGGELRVMPEQIERIRSELLSLCSVPELLARRITLANLGSAIRTRVNGYLSAYDCCTNLDELANSLRDVERTTLRRVYSSLGIPLPNLSAPQRTFLGLC